MLNWSCILWSKSEIRPCLYKCFLFKIKLVCTFTTILTYIQHTSLHLPLAGSVRARVPSSRRRCGNQSCVRRTGRRVSLPWLCPPHWAGRAGSGPYPLNKPSGAPAHWRETAGPGASSGGAGRLDGKKPDCGHPAGMQSKIQSLALAIASCRTSFVWCVSCKGMMSYRLSLCIFFI